jgi:hypothetical protein
LNISKLLNGLSGERCAWRCISLLVTGCSDYEQKYELFTRNEFRAGAKYIRDYTNLSAGRKQYGQRTTLSSHGLKAGDFPLRPSQSYELNDAKFPGSKFEKSMMRRAKSTKSKR